MLYGVLDRGAYGGGVCSGSSVFYMYVCHEGCISVILRARSLGILRCSFPVGMSRVDLKVSMTVRRCIFGLVLLLWGSLARMASVGCIWYEKAAGEVCLIVSRLFHL